MDMPTESSLSESLRMELQVFFRKKLNKVVIKGNVRKTYLLLVAGARSGSETIFTPTALSYATEGTTDDHLCIMQMLITMGVKPYDLNMALCTAARLGFEDKMHLLLDKGAHIEEDTLFYAVMGKHESIIKILLSRGARPCMFSIYEAVKNNWTPVVHMFMKAGVDPDFYGYALKGAVIGNHCALVRLFLDKGAPMVARALLRAAKEGHTRIVRMLLFETNPLVNVYTDEDTHESLQSTLQMGLYLSAKHGHYDIVKMLIRAGANPNNANNTNNTNNTNNNKTLYTAIRKGFFDIVSLLLDNGACTDQRALCLAGKHGHESIVRLLMKKGFRLNREIFYSAANKEQTHIVRIYLRVLDRRMEKKLHRAKN